LFDFIKAEFDFFIENCGFTDEELKVFELKRRGKTHLEIADELNYCERTIKSRIKSIKKKILRVL
jgi:DNA-binding NarL/FixJ family response regulator